MYNLIVYKPSGDEIVWSCHVATYHSEFENYTFSDEQHLIEAIGLYLFNNKNIESSPPWQIYIYQNGYLIYDNDHITFQDNCDHLLQERIIKEANIYADKLQEDLDKNEAEKLQQELLEKEQRQKEIDLKQLAKLKEKYPEN